METVQQEFFSVREVATILNSTTDCVRRWFGRRNGVIDVGPDRPHYGRPYRVLRISRGTLRRFIEERDSARKRRV